MDLGKKTKESRVEKLSDLVAALLVQPSSASIFKDWSTETRYAAVEQLELALLDPTGTLNKVSPLPLWQNLTGPGQLDGFIASLGENLKRTEVQQAVTQLTLKLSQFTGIASIDWTIDSDDFVNGPSNAVNANALKYIKGDFSFPPFQIFHSELGYRDYLRKQWTTALDLVEVRDPPNLIERHVL